MDQNPDQIRMPSSGPDLMPSKILSPRLFFSFASSLHSTPASVSSLPDLRLP